MKLKRIDLHTRWIILLITILILGCSQEVKLVTLDLDVAELVCQDGQRLFESRILDLQGIRSVSANITNHKAEIIYRKADISETEIVAHLADYGFTVNGNPGNPAARRRLPACCLDS